MKYIIPVILAGATIIVAITTALAQAHGAFNGRTSLTPYIVGYGAAIVLLAFAGGLAIANSRHEKERPRIIPKRYGPFNLPAPDGRWHKAGGMPEAQIALARKYLGHHGLIVVNDGETAYEVSIPAAATKVGESKLIFSATYSRFANADGEAFFPAIIEKSHGGSMFGSGLFDEMREQQISAISVAVQYKDAENHWYETICEIKRDVHADGGIAVRYIRQRRIRRPTSAG